MEKRGTSFTCMNGEIVMLDLAEKPELLVVDKKIQSLYVFFRSGTQIKETLRFRLPRVGRVFVYVGIDNMPIALQFVDELIRSKAPRSAESPMPVDVAKVLLFGLAAKMIAFSEAKKMNLGDALIKDALEYAGAFSDTPDAELVN